MNKNKSITVSWKDIKCIPLETTVKGQKFMIPKFKTADCKFECMECNKEFVVTTFNFGDLAMLRQLTCPSCKSGYVKLVNPDLNELIIGGDH